MSVTFRSNAPSKTQVVDEHCLCAQMAEGWMRGATPEALRAAADPTCWSCNGTGVEKVAKSDEPYVNWANDNAEIMLRVLGLPGGCCGEVTVAEARRALMRATARGDLAPFAREERKVYGAPRDLGDGVVEARPLRVWEHGLDQEGIRGRVAQFAAFVRAAAERGATTITWS